VAEIRVVLQLIGSYGQLVIGVLAITSQLVIAVDSTSSCIITIYELVLDLPLFLKCYDAIARLSRD